MCEMSKMPAALRTARCSSTMLEYCTGISQPPNSMSLPPRRWCAANNGVRFSDMPRTSRVKRGIANGGSESAPFFEFQLFLGQPDLFQHELLGRIYQHVWAAGIKHGIGAVLAHDFLDPF